MFLEREQINKPENGLGMQRLLPCLSFLVLQLLPGQVHGGGGVLLAPDLITCLAGFGNKACNLNVYCKKIAQVTHLSKHGSQFTWISVHEEELGGINLTFFK